MNRIDVSFLRNMVESSQKNSAPPLMPVLFLNVMLPSKMTLLCTADIAVPMLSTKVQSVNTTFLAALSSTTTAFSVSLRDFFVSNC